MYDVKLGNICLSLNTDEDPIDINKFSACNPLQKTERGVQATLQGIFIACSPLADYNISADTNFKDILLPWLSQEYEDN